MIDRALVTRKLLLIGKDLEALRVLGAKNAEDYLASETDELLAERRLERLIGRMIRRQLPRNHGDRRRAAA